MIGASDLRMNLLVGDEATHYTNVPGVNKESNGDFPLRFDVFKGPKLFVFYS